MTQAGRNSYRSIKPYGKISLMSVGTVAQRDSPRRALGLPRADTSSTRPVDALLIGGASLLLYAVFRLRPELAASPSVASLAATLVWVCNYPHFASTNYRLYHSRASIAQYPLTSFVTPLVMVAAVDRLLPVAERHRAAVHQAVPAVVSIPLLRTDARHHHGLRPQAGFIIDGWLRHSLTAIHLLDIRSAERMGGGRLARQAVLRMRYPTLGVPLWLPQTPDQVDVGRAGSDDRTADVEGRQRRPAGAADRPAAGVHAIRLVRGHPCGQFAYMVPFFHSLQYLLIAWNVQLKEGLSRTSTRSVGAIRVDRVVALDGHQHRRRAMHCSGRYRTSVASSASRWPSVRPSCSPRSRSITSSSTA